MGATITRTTKTTDNAEKSTSPELHARPDYAVPFPWLPVVAYLGRLTARQNASYVQLSHRQKTTFFSCRHRADSYVIQPSDYWKLTFVLRGVLPAGGPL